MTRTWHSLTRLLAITWAVTACSSDDTAVDGAAGNGSATVESAGAGSGGAGGESAEGISAAGACDIAPDDPEDDSIYSLNSLEDYCSQTYYTPLGELCPETVHAALAAAPEDCETSPRAYQVTGCGYQHLAYRTPVLSWGQVFDEATGDLVGAYYLSDTPLSPPCRISRHVAGVRVQPCFEFEPNTAATDANVQQLCGTAGAGGSEG